MRFGGRNCKIFEASYIPDFLKDTTGEFDFSRHLPRALVLHQLTMVVDNILVYED